MELKNASDNGLCEGGHLGLREDGTGGIVA
jgi:hypothetical protein